MKDFEDKNSELAQPLARVNPSEERTGPKSSHPANASPLADMLGQLQRSHGNTYVQQVVANMSETNSAASGQPLDPGVKSEMETAFDENFSDVVIHHDHESEQTADELDARALTRGRDVYFGKGEYNPATREGKELLAHELTHVIQQRGETSQARQMGQADDAFEREADRAATAIGTGAPIHVAKQGNAPGVQLQPRGTPAPSQQQHEEPPQAPAGFMNVTINVSAHPSGVLPNGVRYRYVAQSPDPYLDLVIPRAMTVSAMSPRNQTRVLYVTGGRELSPSERAAVIVVTPVPGQTAVVQVTFQQSNSRGSAIFELPRVR
jgi:hypothetical protein